MPAPKELNLRRFMPRQAFSVEEAKAVSIVGDAVEVASGDLARQERICIRMLHGIVGDAV